MTAPPTDPSNPVAPDPVGLSRLLADWERAGLLDGRQRTAIEAFEQQRVLAAMPADQPVGGSALPRPARTAPPGRRIPAAAEALGYLGGILALVGVGLLLSRVWNDLGVGGRLAVLGATSVALVAAGAFLRVERDQALRRLRGFLWLLSTLAAAAFGAMMAEEWATARGAAVGAAAAGFALVHAGALWRWRPGLPLQQASALVALPVLVGCLLVQVVSGGLAALVVWTVGLAVFVCGLRRLTPIPSLTTVVGAVTLVVGGGLVSADWLTLGLLLTVCSAIGVIAVAAYSNGITVRSERWVLALVGSITLFQALPSTLIHFADQAGIVTGLVTWAIGVGIVAVAFLVRRLHGRPAIVLVGGLVAVGGAALCGVQSVAFATLFGLASAIAMVALGTRPGAAIMLLFGSLGLLVNVPWAVNWFFPGEGRAPLLIFVSGLLIIGVAVLLARSAGRIRAEFGGPAGGPTGGATGQSPSQALRKSSAA